MKPDTPASVYVFDDHRRGLLKVGFSVNPRERAKMLRLRERHVLHVSSPSVAAHKVERVAHRLLTLAGKHVDGELFAATLQQCVEAIEQAERVVAGMEPGPPMPPRKQFISLAFDTKLLKRLEKWRAAQDVRPSKTAVHESALREFLDKRERRK